MQGMVRRGIISGSGVRFPTPASKMVDAKDVATEIHEETEYHARKGKGDGHIAIEIDSNNHDMDTVGKILSDYDYRLSGIGGKTIYFQAE